MQLSQMPNIGPVLAGRLSQSGIQSGEELCALGAEQAFLRLVKNAFRMRRKTLLNNLLQCGMGKEQAQKTLEAAGLAPSVRAEALSLADFVRLYGILCEPDVANGKFVV